MHPAVLAAGHDSQSPDASLIIRALCVRCRDTRRSGSQAVRQSGNKAPSRVHLLYVLFPALRDSIHSFFATCLCSQPQPKSDTASPIPVDLGCSHPFSTCHSPDSVCFLQPFHGAFHEARFDLTYRPHPIPISTATTVGLTHIPPNCSR